MTRQPWGRLAGFIAIGGLGFVVEATIIAVAGASFGVPAILARAYSFPSAVLATWWLNRKYNFRSQNNALSEGGRYFATQAVGALVNLGTFALCVSVFPALAAWPVVALGIGASLGLAVNFGLAYAYVFRKRRIKNGE